MPAYCGLSRRLTACWGKPNIWRQPLVPNVSLLINSTTRNRVEYIGRLDYAGRPADTKKQIYALGFAIYGLSEYHRATGDEEALTYAIRLFKSIEQYSFDSVKNGYCEALTRDWNDISDMRLSDKDENERKTMNTHLHILEPYTNLYLRVERRRS